MKTSPKQSQAIASSSESQLRRCTLGGYRYVRMRWRLLFGFVDTIGNLLLAVAEFLSRWLPSQNADGEIRRILLVQFDHLGDAIVTTAMFGAFKHRFPDARIDVLAAPWNRAVFDLVPEVDRVYVCRHNRFADGRSLAWIPATLAWGLRLRQQSYDLAIDVRGEFPHNVLLWLTGARRRLGWASGGGGFLLTDKPEFVCHRPEVESRAALLECLDVQCMGRLQPTVQPSRAAAETAETAWNELESTMGSAPQICGPMRVVLHVGAGTSAKRWPVEHWRRLVERLTTERHVSIALVGVSRDRATARAILGASPLSCVADWTGRFSVDGLAAVLQRADVLVGADSGPAHLAAAVGASVVALFSGTNSFEQWQPCGNRVRTLHCDVPCSPCHRRTCPMAQHPCMRGIQPDAVMHALAEILPAGADRERIAASPEKLKGPVQ